MLVTGGAGFIGSNLARELLLLGTQVRILDNLQSGYERNLPSDAVWLRGDVADAAVVDSSAEDVDAIFHLAASVGNQRSIDDPLQDARVNVIGTLNVLEAARRHGVRKVVISSSAGIFGEPRVLPIREDHAAEPDTPYGASKLGAEKAGLAYAKLYGIGVVCLRYFNVYGPNQRFDPYGNVIPIFASRMLAGEPITVFGDGEQTRDFVNVHDVVQANLKAAAAPGLSGAFNIGSGAQVTINQLVTLLGGAIGRPAEVHSGPPRPGDARHSLADIGAAREALGYQPTVGLASGLEEYIEWARTETEVPA